MPNFQNRNDLVPPYQACQLIEMMGQSTKMKKTPKYPLEVFWSDEDEGYIAIAPDLLGCSAWGKTEAEVVGEIHHAVEAWLEAAMKAGNPIPATTVPGSTIGKFLMRVHKRPHVDQ